MPRISSTRDSREASISQELDLAYDTVNSQAQILQVIDDILRRRNLTQHLPPPIPSPPMYECLPDNTSLDDFIAILQSYRSTHPSSASLPVILLATDELRPPFHPVTEDLLYPHSDSPKTFVIL